ncbi:hypothetical protein [Amycolatopsis nigrescens]|uniref:hypothetical protein n=1 Tax=Amycolatopsis nigrescens TaxID=381445 RepID=UPI0003703981|nr:hypothetical protein [Amycolatopsis nigrescens]
MATDRASIDSVARVLAGLRVLEDTTGAAEVLPSVLAQRALMTRLAHSARDGVRPVAAGLLSELEQYLGWLSIPLERWEDSRRHLDRACVLALEANDPIRLSHALSFQSFRNLRRGKLETAEALNDAALRNDRIHPGLRTYLRFQRAEVLARGGSKQGSLTALGLAERSVDALADDDDRPASCYYYTPGFFAGQGAFTLLALGDRVGARKLANEALSVLPASWRDSEWSGRWRKIAALD